MQYEDATSCVWTELWVRVIWFKTETASVHNHFRIHIAVPYIYTHKQVRTNTFPFAVITFLTYTAVLMTKSRLFVKTSTIWEPTEENHTKHKSRLLVNRSEPWIFRIKRRINISTQIFTCSPAKQRIISNNTY